MDVWGAGCGRVAFAAGARVRRGRNRSAQGTLEHHRGKPLLSTNERALQPKREPRGYRVGVRRPTARQHRVPGPAAPQSVRRGSASIGDSRLKYDYHYNITNFTLAYGITDRLLVGFELPYYVVRNDVTASVNSDPGSSANVGLRTGPGPGPLCGSAAPVLPLSCPNTRRFTTADVNRLLGAGLPGSPGSASSPSGTSPTTASVTSCWA